MGYFADIGVSQGSAATYARCGGIFNIHLTTNLPRNLPVIFLNRLRLDRIVVMSLWPTILAHPVDEIQTNDVFKTCLCSVQLPTSAVNVTLPAFAAERRVATPLLLSAGACCRRAAQQSIDISCRPGAQQQIRRCCGRSNFTPLTNKH